MKNMIVGQSGGPTAVINGSLYGVVSEGFKHPESIEHVYGMINGIEGFLSNQIMDMHPLLKNGDLEQRFPRLYQPAAGRCQKDL